jgi:alanine racemase
MAMVKANAFGHGAVEVAQAVVEAGAAWLGVAAPSEGLALRNAGLSARILVLGYTPAHLAEEAIARDLALNVYDFDLARAYAATARAQGRTAQVHVKVDTGMGRLGIPPEDAARFIDSLRSLGGLAVEGLFTHFATSDLADTSFALGQIQKFNDVLDTLVAAGARPPIVHAANSAAAFTLPQARYDLVRTGIALYGLDPSDDVPCPSGFRPALEWKTAVAQVKTLPPGHPVSYGTEYVTRGEERIAVIPVGYADGFRRRVPNEALGGGRHVPVVGRVCMDFVMLNVTRVPGLAVGDEVVLIGRQGQAAITADEVARRWGTINYDVTAGIMARVPRIFVS